MNDEKTIIMQRSVSGETRYTRKVLDFEAKWAARNKMATDGLRGRPTTVKWTLVISKDSCLLVSFRIPNCEHVYLTSVAI